MSKSDLKAAMDSLQVKKPLKLPARQPQFKAPTPVAEPALVPVESQVAPDTGVAATTLVSGLTKASPKAPVDLPTTAEPQPQEASSTSVVAVAPVDVPTEVPKNTPVLISSPVDQQTLVPTPTQVAADDEMEHSAGNQDSSVMLEALAAPKLHNGYTRLPNNVLMRIATGELVRSEIQVLLLIARFTISFRRRYAPLSKAVLERQSGLRGPAILQAIADLVAKGLIEKIPGDQYRPNQLGLVFTEEWDFFSNSVESGTHKTSVARETQVASKTKVREKSRVELKTSVPLATAAPVATPTPAEVAAATHFKDIKIIENNNSLSGLPDPVRDYFADLKPARKRESEWKAYQGLRSDYSEGDIATCFEHISAQGVRNGESAQPCHSPMAFLSKAIGEILPVATQDRRKARERSERERQWAEQARLDAEKEASDAAEWARMECAFLSAFPGEDQQHEALVELLRGLPYRPHTQAGRTMAIGRWWNQMKDQNGC